MSEPEPNYAARMVRQEGDIRSHLGEPLITVDPKNLDARARHQSTMAMATLATMGAWVNRDRVFRHPSNAEFNTRTLTGLMGCWEFEYLAKSISLDGGGRKEYVDVSKFVAVGQGDESGALTNNLLNEGSKNLQQKGKK